MPVPVLGTAHLFGLTPDGVSASVLDAAWAAGYRAFDTAPLYGHGRSEVELGARLAGWPSRPQLTSKVGLEPVAPDSRGTRIAKSVARRLPGVVQQRVRPGGDGPRGVFDPDLVRRSLDRTLSRLGRVDRLMLHEVHAEDLTDEVLELLTRFRARGDVGGIGVATGNAAAGPAARRAPDLLTSAHLEVGPFAPPADLPPSVSTVVGHGVLGPGARGLRRLSAWSQGDDPTAVRWRTATADTRWSGTGGLADALVARAAALPVSDLVVATSRPERLANLRDLVARTTRPPADVVVVVEELVAAARAASEPPTG